MNRLPKNTPLTSEQLTMLQEIRDHLATIPSEKFWTGRVYGPKGTGARCAIGQFLPEAEQFKAELIAAGLPYENIYMSSENKLGHYVIAHYPKVAFLTLALYTGKVNDGTYYSNLSTPKERVLAYLDEMLTEKKVVL